MNFYSMRDLRTDPKKMWDDLQDGKEVVLTNISKPSVLIINIPEGMLDETVRAVRQAKAMIAFDSMRSQASKSGFLSDEEIERIISQVRDEHNS